MKATQRSGKAWVVILVLIVAVAALLTFTDLGSLGWGSEVEATLGQEVQRGPLRISVVERGNLKAADSVVLKSEVEGRTTILYLIEEGTIVEAGTLLCELDTSSLVERRVSQDISVQNSEASWVKAKQNLEIQISQNESDIARGERDLEFTRLDLEKYTEGEHDQEVKSLEEDIFLADEELKRAVQDLEWSEKLAAAGFLESTQLEADRLAKERATIKLNQANRALELFNAYEDRRRLAELQADVEESERELDRIKLQAAARLVDYQADERTSKARFDLESDELAKLDEQIEKARIHAPVGGMVVYYQESGGGRHSNNDPIQEGTEIRERQEIITIPSADGMVAEASLHESVFQRVKEGMSCVVTVDAVPEKTFRGRVRFKAPMADQNSWWANPDLRVYRTEIELTDIDTRLRPGMSCSTEIVVEELEDALHVPVQSIFLDQGKPVCFLARGSGYEMRSVEVGQNNGKWVEIVTGLSEGETVFLSQPAGATLRPAVAEVVPLGEEMPVPAEGDRGAAGRGMQGQAWQGEGMQREGMQGEGMQREGMQREGMRGRGMKGQGMPDPERQRPAGEDGRRPGAAPKGSAPPAGHAPREEGASGSEEHPSSE